MSEVLFTKFERLLTLTQDTEIRKLLNTNLMSFALTDTSIEKLKQIFDKTHPTLSDVELDMSEKWRVVLKINTSNLYSKGAKKIYFDYMAFNDKTDAKTQKKFFVDALTTDKKEMSELWSQYLDPNRSMSYKELGMSITGFTHSKKPEAVRKEYFDRFFTDCVSLMKNDTKQVALEFFYDGIPKTDDIEYLIENLRGGSG